MWTRRAPLLLLPVVVLFFCLTNGRCDAFVQLDKFIEEVMACKGIPGMALAVVYGSDTETRWYGLRDVRRALPVDRHTLFPIGSLTKAFTSALAAHVLGDRDDVDWDTPLRKLLGDSFEMPDKFRTHDLCLRDILAHKVGLEEYTHFQLMGLNLTGEQLESRLRYFDERLPFRSEFSYSNLMYGLAGHVLERLTNGTWTDALHRRLTGPLGMADTHTARDVLEGEGQASTSVSSFPSRLRYFDERLPFRSEFSYSNLMYGLAGHVLERLTNGTWTDALHRRLTGPLGMADTHTARDVLEGEGLRGNLAQGYLVDPLQGATLALDEEQLWAVTDSVVAAGGVVSTAGDMARWMRFHLKGGKTPEGMRLVRKRLLKETHAPQMTITSGTFPRESRYRPEAAVDDTVPAYSMGWVTGTYRGYRRLVHGGTLPSYNSLLTLFPSENVGIFTVSNGIAQFQSDVHWSIHNYISDFALGKIPWLNSSTICQHRHRRHTWSSDGFSYFSKPSADADIVVSSRRSRETTSGIQQTAPTTTASDPLRKYAGVYFSPALGNFSVRLSLASSSLRFRYGLFGTGHLQPGLVQEHVMRMVFTGPLWYIQGFKVVFTKTSEGSVISLHVDSGPDNKPTFHRVDTADTDNSEHDVVASSAAHLSNLKIYLYIFVLLQVHITYSIFSIPCCQTFTCVSPVK
ncbi:uncharacterized protein LOC118413178 [Branchiostoma floridae]|uniref:Uncharacterized protein LOC118413178 n=1 Tax=Branchiostoma floridae TaxID=7739 RepID=A0A9J7KXT2_BRAFL|nr:uncharacterized protein LOC118413178 [Branchiostoma floridae]